MTAPWLDAANIFSPVVSEQAGPALAALSRLAAVMRSAEDTPDGASKRAARAAYAELLDAVAVLTRAEPPTARADREELRRAWVEGVLLWMHFCETSSEPLVDSVGAKSIRSFPIDLPPDAQAFARLTRALGESAELGEQELADAERRVAHLVSVLPLKSALTRALKERYEASGADARTRVRLLQEHYGGVPFREGDVDLVITSTAVFFVIPVHGQVLDVPDWAARAEPERQGIQEFLARLARGNLTETWRFPAFGLFDRDRLDGALVEELAVRTGCRADVVEHALVTMVSVLPKAELDQYLVHDAWGHTWQEVLNEFEWEYDRLRRIADPLTPDTGPFFGGEGVRRLRDAFGVEDGRTVLDEAGFLATVEADLRGRIQAGLSAALSEVFADFVEAKYSRLNPSAPLPTSSLLEEVSLKLDLTIKDVLRHARRWSRPYRKFCSDTVAAELFATELLAQGVLEAGLTDALAQARALLESRFASAFVYELEAAPGHMPSASVASRALLELAQLARELEQVLADTVRERALPAWTRPAQCPDLWAVSLSHLYERDRTNAFWTLDWLVRDPVRAFCGALEDALARDRTPD